MEMEWSVGNGIGRSKWIVYLMSCLFYYSIIPLLYCPIPPTAFREDGDFIS